MGSERKDRSQAKDWPSLILVIRGVPHPCGPIQSAGWGQPPTQATAWSKPGSWLGERWLAGTSTSPVGLPQGGFVPRWRCLGDLGTESLVGFECPPHHPHGRNAEQRTVGEDEESRGAQHEAEQCGEAEEDGLWLRAVVQAG